MGNKKKIPVLLTNENIFERSWANELIHNPQQLGRQREDRKEERSVLSLMGMGMGRTEEAVSRQLLHHLREQGWLQLPSRRQNRMGEGRRHAGRNQ